MSEAIGIDLGTTNACVAHVVKSRVEKIIINDQGSRKTPSFVAFAEPELLIGEEALFQAARNPKNTIFGTKRLIGRKIDDPEIQKDIKNFPFEVTDEDGKAFISVEHKGKPRVVAPEEISSMILTTMKCRAEKYLKTEIKDAVITVPAHFNYLQRLATREAGRIAGLNVLRLIPEPTAAAISYGLEKKGRCDNILIFDLGGGTFNVSLLGIRNGSCLVKATGGDMHLGGNDFDSLLVDFLVNEFKEKNSVDVSENQCVLGRLHLAAERAKRTLSIHEATSIRIESLYNGTSLNTSITRTQFEVLCQGLFIEVTEVLKEFLLNAKIDKTRIDQVVLIGGSTRIPRVRDLVSVFFNGKELHYSNPDGAVAHGAAILAAKLAGDVSTRVQDLVLSDATALSVGIGIRGGVMEPIIPRGSTLPIEKSRVFKTTVDRQSSFLFQIFEGERMMAEDNILIGKFELTGLTPAPCGVTKVQVTFQFDANGILTVAALEKGTHNSNFMTITNDTGRLTELDAARMVEVACQHQESDKVEAAYANARSHLELYLDAIRSKFLRREGERFHSRRALEDIIDIIDYKLESANTSVAEILRMEKLIRNYAPHGFSIP